MEAEAAKNYALRIRGTGKTFNQHKALDSIDLDVVKGEMVALIGPSGSGKSTLLRLCNGLLVADPDRNSSIWVNGSQIQEAGRLSSGIRKARSRIGFVFQSFNLVGRLSLHKNVLVGRSAHTPLWRSLLLLHHDRDRRKAMEVLASVGLRGNAEQRASTLSGGQKQRGAIARAIAQGAELILADEPIASLDPSSAQSVMAILKELNRSLGITVLVSLHQVDVARRYCDRAIALSKGSIHFDGPMEDLDDALRSLYGDQIELGAPLQLEPQSNSEKVSIA